VHGDAPVSVFMSLSALTFFIYARRLSRDGVEPLISYSPSWLPAARYLIASAILGGLAALTKAPGQFMALFIILLSLLYSVSELRR
jgi:4-amino-4-deoxy-L-arabinose transferase-like glycosyltransferase